MEQIKNKACLFVAEQASNIIGMCSCQALVSTAEAKVAKVGLVEDVVVDNAFRGNGVGKAMLQHMEQWAKQQGMTRLQLMADSTNSNAIDFYQSRDWQGTQLVTLKKSIS
ncbi:MAG: GNAT family N-acetyltransferase [Gammaproteobacteria bacterium]